MKIDHLKDEEIRQLITDCNALLNARDQERKAKAMEDARAVLAAAGLSIDDLRGKAKRPAKKTGFVPKAGVEYRHPDNPELKANGTGKKPKWWHELLASGKEPIEAK